MLHPKCRSLKTCTNKERYLCCKCIRDQLKVLHGKYLTSNIHEYPLEPQQKKLKATDILFACFEDDSLCIEDSSSDINETLGYESDKYASKYRT